jgi:aspartyl-tRNA(Asn)/glutamyl-tRNA(Gln) amidotransferase subunit C
MSIGREDVLHIARLARLAVPEDELPALESQLVAILEAVGKVSELDLSDVEPMSHPLDLANVWDEDEPRSSLSRDEALSNASDPHAGSFRVPAVGE